MVNGLNARNRYRARLQHDGRNHERQAACKDHKKRFALKNVLGMPTALCWRTIRDTIGRLSVIPPQRESWAGIPWLHTNRPSVRTWKPHLRAASGEKSCEPRCLRPAR